jgi:hypothetical protein
MKIYFNVFLHRRMFILLETAVGKYPCAFLHVKIGLMANEIRWQLMARSIGRQLDKL